jgi:predicted transcriptional regulator
MPASVRINPNSWKTLKEIADCMGETMQAVLDQAIEAYRRQWLLERANKAYVALRNDQDKWEEEVADRKEWDAALGDGLGDDE